MSEGVTYCRKPTQLPVASVTLYCMLLPPTNEVWSKVIFSQACVKNSVHRGCLVPGGGACSWGGGCGIPAYLAGFPGPLPRGKFRGIWLWEEGSPGPHPRMKLRGIWSRPTPKGEVEVDLVQAHTQGGS